MNKYEWIEAVMASKIKHAVKTFAFGLYKHMNREGTCYPGDKALMESTGMSRGHFSEYRRVLIDAGMVAVEVRKTKNGDSYTYRIPENASNGGVLGTENATNGDKTAPNGEQNATNGDKSATSGGMNTVDNTTKNTRENTFKTTDASAGSDDESDIREEVEPSANVETTAAPSSNANSRDEVQGVADIVGVRGGWKFGNVLYQREFDALAARQGVLEKEKTNGS